MRYLLFIPLLLMIQGCNSDYAAFPTVSAAERQSAMEKWSRSCALCHVDGNAGAPQVGDWSAWEPRLRQSTETLLDHTVNGLGNMPPLGYCMDCSEQDFLVLTEFMAGQDTEND